ncbi:MAG: hypothetical protein ABIP94_07390 [Planctomycetota bacterium]
MRSVPAILFYCLGSSLAWAQDNVDRLVAQLHDDRHRLAALKRVVEVGAAALPALIADLERHMDRGDNDAATHVLLAIERLGSASAPAAKDLSQRLAAISPELLVPMLRAIGCMGPAAMRAAPDLVEVVKDIKTPIGKERQEWELAVQRLTFEGVARDEMVGMLGELVPACVVSLWIAEDPRRGEGLVNALLAAHRSALGSRWQLMVEETALALVRTTSDPVQREIVWGHLLGYHDPVVRFDAATALRRDPGAAITAVPALMTALGDTERGVLREVMITLGFFSDEAMAALPLLAKWRANPDVELRHIAAATSQSIRGNLTAAPAAVAELLDGGKDEAARVMQRIATFGRHATAHLEALRSTATAELRDRCNEALAALDR